MFTCTRPSCEEQIINSYDSRKQAREEQKCLIKEYIRAVVKQGKAGGSSAAASTTSRKLPGC